MPPRQYNPRLIHLVATHLGKIYGRGGDFEDGLNDTDYARATAALEGIYDFLESAADSERYFSHAETHHLRNILTAKE